MGKMAGMDFDLLLDSLIQQCNAPEVSYIEKKYAKVLKLKSTPSKGEGVFAERFLSVKDPICALKYPTMMAIDSDFLPTTCYHCLALTASPLPLPNYGCEPINLRICNGCHLARFCNKDCQLQAWMQFHKYECKIFKRTQHNLLPAATRAVMRAVLLKDRDLMRNEEWNRITRLTSHEHVLAARGRSNLTEMAEGIKHLADSSMSIETIQRLIFIMRTNATELPTPIHGGIGVMLDPLMARFNHNCEPNLAIHRPQHTMTSGWMDSVLLSEDDRQTFAQIVPLRDVNEGEELLFCYVVPTASVKDRRATLTENYLFDCNCFKCLSDTADAAMLASEQSGLLARFQQWSRDVKRNISRVSSDSHALRKAAAAMERSQQYLEYPVLYTTSDFPQMAMSLILEALKTQAYDEALINLLRLYFLVNPERFVGRHNSTNIYTIFLILAVFDAITGTPTASGVIDGKKDKRLHKSSNAGLSRAGLAYWRHRIRADLRKRLEGSAMNDLSTLIQELEEHVQNLMAPEQDTEGKELRVIAEQEMRAVLKLTESRWKIVLQRAGC